MIRKTLYISLLAAALYACAPTTQQINQSMDAWVGQHQSALYQAWGPPAEITEDGAGGSILIYRTSVSLGQRPGVVKTTDSNTTYYTTPKDIGYDKTRMFYVDASGRIYGHRWQGK